MAAAERLRSKASERALPQVGAGIISAWPRADLTLRGLAAFIDVTIVLLAFGVVLVLATQRVLPDWVTKVSPAVTLFVVLTLFNDVVLQILWGGSLGKRLVVLTLMGLDGRPPSAPRIVLRAAVKWILFPGWIWFFIDADHRTAHDLICGTLVLKGRKR
jgi:uncharacterized RDD family membrane protein YckC